MDYPDLKEVRHLIRKLKKIKSRCFVKSLDTNNFALVFETCRMIDLLSFPLFFYCEKYYKVNLSDVYLDSYLRMPYERFSLNYKLIIRDLTNLLLFTNFIDRKLEISDVKESILNIYIYILQNNFNNIKK